MRVTAAAPTNEPPSHARRHSQPGLNNTPSQTAALNIGPNITPCYCKPFSTNTPELAKHSQRVSGCLTEQRQDAPNNVHNRGLCPPSPRSPSEQHICANVTPPRPVCPPPTPAPLRAPHTARRMTHSYFEWHSLVYGRVLWQHRAPQTRRLPPTAPSRRQIG